MMKNLKLSHKLFQALVFAAMAVSLLLNGAAPASASAGGAGATPVAASQVNVAGLLANVTTIAADAAHDLVTSISEAFSSQNTELAVRHRHRTKNTLVLSSNSKTTLSNAGDQSLLVAGRTKGPHRRRKL